MRILVTLPDTSDALTAETVAESILKHVSTTYDPKASADVVDYMPQSPDECHLDGLIAARTNIHAACPPHYSEQQRLAWKRGFSGAPL